MKMRPPYSERPSSFKIGLCKQGFCRLITCFSGCSVVFRGIFPCLQSFDPEQPFQTGFEPPCEALAEYLAETKTLKTLRIRGQNALLIVKASWWVREASSGI